MRIAFVADARSPIARSWVNYFVDAGHDVHVISSYPCAVEEWPRVKLYQFPIGLNRWSRVKTQLTQPASSNQRLRKLTRKSMPLVRAVAAQLQTHLLGVLDARRQGIAARSLLAQIQPDIVHALRIPYEGMLAVTAVAGRYPFLVSIWGNDLTLFATTYYLIGRQTRKVLQQANAVHTDCQRDARLIEDWGYDSTRPILVVPSAGGIHTHIFCPGKSSNSLLQRLEVVTDVPIIINPRGIRGYVRTDLFFQAIPMILEAYPNLVFLCCGMQGNATAEKWVRDLNIDNNVRLLPSVPHAEMADLYRLAAISVSPSSHDGTPNTLLESMACGCLPVAGDIASVREWITDGYNGILCPLDSPLTLAQAILRGLSDRQLQQTARQYNLKLIAERADYVKVMEQAEQFYRETIKGFQAGHSPLLNRTEERDL